MLCVVLFRKCCGNGLSDLVVGIVWNEVVVALMADKCIHVECVFTAGCVPLPDPLCRGWGISGVWSKMPVQRVSSFQEIDICVHCTCEFGHVVYMVDYQST